MSVLRRPPALLAFLLLAAASSPRLVAQLPPVTVPKGQVRIDLSGRFDMWDQTYFAGVKQDAAADFSRDPATGGWLPGLHETELGLGRVTGAQGISLSLGRTFANMSVNVVTAGIGAAYGITSRLTIFATVPILRVRVLDRVAVDSTNASAGFNPASPLFGTTFGAGVTAGFFSQLGVSLDTLNSRLNAGAFNNDPAKKALAQATLTRGTALQTDLQSLFNSAFLPLSGTPPATALGRSIDSLRSRLANDLNIPGFVASPALPTAGLPSGGLEDYATRTSGPVAAQPFQPPNLRFIGDIEVGAAYAWLDGRPPARGIAVRSVLQGIVRLRTGKLPRSDGFFDVGTGEHQPDVQGDLVTDFMGSRAGARVTARYVLQLPGQQQRRLTPPDQPIAPAATLAAVTRDPGDIMEGSIEPYVRIAPHFALVAGVQHWAKGIDKYTYVSGQPPIEGTSPDVLAQGSKENGTVLSAGISFSHDGRKSGGRIGMPMDAMLRGELVAGSTEGRVPAKRSISFVMRLYQKIF